MSSDARQPVKTPWLNALAGAVLCVALGWGALIFAQRLVLLSYDLLPLVRRTPAFPDLTILYLDDTSFAELEQDRTQSWDRNLHANLLDRLTADGAKVVVFDIVFDTPTTSTADANFAAAIRANGRVVLAAALNSRDRGQVQSNEPVLPINELLEAAASYGIASMASSSEKVARQYYAGTAYSPSLPEAAALLVAPPGAGKPPKDEAPRWLNYYGPRSALATLPWLSYLEATNHPPGYFRDRAVFIGAFPKTLRAHDETDEFKTPHQLWSDGLFPGVAITAIAYLNYLRNDAFHMMAWSAQLVIIVLSGLLAGSLLASFRPLPAVVVAALLIIICVAAAFVAAQRYVWFGWTVIAFVQVPVALGWSVLTHFQRLSFEKRVLEETVEATSRLTVGTAANSNEVQIPDHVLLKCVGKGAYGEVWLARNAIGGYHAVKVVKREAFPSDEPYEREFRGMQKFMPISRGHAGFVHVLHVGRNEVGRFFYYIMEASDDVRTGQRIDPGSYTPKTLSWELTQRGQLLPNEALELGLSLALALDHLHQRGLIHRDIKPANIIYVEGAPKLADIGLVTDIATTGQEVSELGTKGYIPPEGPGRASADVYALGKVLYEAALGRDRLLFPEVPTSVLEQNDEDLLKRLNHVISRTCATDLTERYTSAEALHAALLQLRSGTGSAGGR